jgi:hypothetical protein
LDRLHSSNWSESIGFIVEDGSEDYEKGLSPLSIHLRTNGDQSICQLLSAEASAHAISIVDNGSSDGITHFISDNRLTARILGVQQHCLNYDLSLIDDQKMVRLKDIRTQPDLSETILRTTEKVVFNLNAIRRSDQIGCIASNTTGLTIEEACLIAKYIGASDLITEVYFTGISIESDTYDMLSTNVANLLWYVAEGMGLRNVEFDLESNQNLHFTVLPEGHDLHLDFVKSNRTGRWWIKVPTEDGPMYMSCTKKDYDEACENNLTNRIAKAFKIV